MKIGVVIPAKNEQAFIGDCIASALTQTLLPSLILLVDDGSTDRTVEVVNGFHDERIKVIHSELPLGARAHKAVGSELWEPHMRQSRFRVLPYEEPNLRSKVGWTLGFSGLIDVLCRRKLKVCIAFISTISQRRGLK